MQVSVDEVVFEQHLQVAVQPQVGDCLVVAVAGAVDVGGYQPPLQRIRDQQPLMPTANRHAHVLIWHHSTKICVIDATSALLSAWPQRLSHCRLQGPRTAAQLHHPLL